jgi:cytochrome c oxidase cbb3-type subunit 3
MMAALFAAGIGYSCMAVGVGHAPVTPHPAQAKTGREIYNFRCYFCHGYSGNAKTVAASFLTPPPIDFTRVKDRNFTQEHVVSVLKTGKPGTAMQSFRSVLTDSEMARVAAFVLDEFVRRKAPNTRYHTPENGWPDPQRYRAAFPFATGEIPVNRPWQELSEEQARGKRLFLESCIICHDRGRAADNNITWEATPLSYPRNEYSNSAPIPAISKPDAITSASPYLLHEIPPKISGMTAVERQGEKLFQANCAFCHAADGTGKNWIGSFLQPHPRNLRDPLFMSSMTRARLSATIREGLPNTSMPAWKSVLTEKDIVAIVAYVARAFHPLPN